MAFVLPTFNETADIYTWTPFVPPTVVRITVDCQLRAPSMTVAAAAVVSTNSHCGMVLLVPALTDIRDQYSGAGNNPDVVEVPPGSGRRYTVYYVDDVGKGFPNEHRFVILQKYGLGTWPVPIP